MPPFPTPSDFHASPDRKPAAGPSRSFSGFALQTPPVTPQSKLKPGDGFDAQELSVFPPEWKRKGGKYAVVKIGFIAPKPGLITFTGRIVNFWEAEVNKMTKSATAAKSKLTMIVGDETGVIEVNYWMTKRNPIIPKLGTLVQVYTSFVSRIKRASDSSRPIAPATVECSISLSDTDKAVEFMECTDPLACRLPYGVAGAAADDDGTQDIVPLQVYIEGGGSESAKVLMCVKWVGVKKTIIRQNAGDGKGKDTLEKLDVGVFDDTAEGILTLWGSMIASTADDRWKAYNTVLLLTAPGVKEFFGKAQFQISKSTLVDVDPVIPAARWLRGYAATMAQREEPWQPFPYDSFDWNLELHGPIRLKYTLGDLDELSRERVDDQVVGYVSVIITQLNLLSLKQGKKLWCGKCTSCGASCCTNTPTEPCKTCGHPVAFQPNAHILADETGSVLGRRMLWSNKSWIALFDGKDPRDVLEIEKDDPDWDTDRLNGIEVQLLFTRITLAVGWDPVVGRMAVWDVFKSQWS